MERCSTFDYAFSLQRIHHKVFFCFFSTTAVSVILLIGLMVYLTGLTNQQTGVSNVMIG